MTATTSPIPTPMRDGELIPVPLKAGAKVLEGTLCVIDNTGFALDSASVAGANHVCLGVYDNSATNVGGQDGDVVAVVRRKRQFLLSNEATDLITQAELGTSVYVADNSTLAKTDGTGTRSVAGRFMGFDLQYPDLVWVEI